MFKWNNVCIIYFVSYETKIGKKKLFVRVILHIILIHCKNNKYAGVDLLITNIKALVV